MKLDKENRRAKAALREKSLVFLLMVLTVIGIHVYDYFASKEITVFLKETTIESRLPIADLYKTEQGFGYYIETYSSDPINANSIMYHYCKFLLKRDWNLEINKYSTPLACTKNKIDMYWKSDRVLYTNFCYDHVTRLSISIRPSKNNKKINIQVMSSFDSFHARQDCKY